MPKATLIRKPSINIYERIGNNNDSGSVDLLGVLGDRPVDGDDICPSGDKPLQGQQKIEEKREGTRRVQENDGGNTENPQENRTGNPGKRGGFKKDVYVRSDKDSASDGEKHRGAGTSETSECGKGKVRERKKTDNGTRSAAEKGKRDSKSAGRGAEKEGKEQKGADEERKRPQDFERKEFQDSSGVASQRPVIHGPYPTDELFCVDIVLDDGYLYRVSEGSVKDGKYIQGLDSRFLISRFHPYTKKAIS